MLQRIITSLLLILIGIGGFFVNVETQTNIPSQSGYIWFSIDTILASPIANAGWGWSDATTAKNEITTWTNQFITLINTLLGILTIMVTPAIVLASWLMSPDWTSGDIFGLRDIMYQLWITVSNIIYFVYAILLIIIALGTIFGSEKFGYKVLLPRLALGILMVPFTWWFVQWTISLSTIVTASVMTIPRDVMKAQDVNGWWSKKMIPQEVTVDTTGTGAQKITNCGKEPAKCISFEEMTQKWWGIYGSLLVYAYGIFKLDTFVNIDGTLDAIKWWWQIINQVLLGVIMFVVFGILVMALIFMLMMRAIKLWMYAIFSPLFTIHFVLGKELLTWESLEDFSLKEFIGLAFVPAVVWLCLSFWLVILSVIQSPGISANSTLQSTPTTCTGPSITSEQWCKIAGLFGNPENTIIRRIGGSENGENGDGITVDNKAYTENIVNFAGMKMIFKWKPTGQSDVDIVSWGVSAANTTSGILSAGGGIFGTLILDIIAIIFIWAAFMAGKNVSKAVKAAVQPFEDMGKSIGDLGKKLPQYAPIPGLGVSPKGMANLVSGVEQKVSSNSIEKTQESRIGRALGANKWASWEGVTKTKIAEDRIENGSAAEATTALKEAIIALQKDQNSGKIVKDQIGGLVEKLKKREGSKHDIDTILQNANIDATGFKRLLRDYGTDKKVDKENLHIGEFQSNILGAKAGGTNAGSTWPVISASRIPNTNNVTISIEWTSIGITNTAGNQEIQLNPTQIAKLQTAIGTKTWVISESDFITRMTASGTMTVEAAENLIAKIKTEGKWTYFIPPVAQTWTWNTTNQSGTQAWTGQQGAPGWSTQTSTPPGAPRARPSSGWWPR
jgi:hypothetical protein